MCEALIIKLQTTSDMKYIFWLLVAILSLASCNQAKPVEETVVKSDAPIPTNSRSLDEHPPVQWTFAHQKRKDGRYELTFTAKIEPSWNVYSQNLPSNDGPVATEIVFESNNVKTLKAKAEENGHKWEGIDETFKMKITKFHDEMTMTHIVKHTDGKPVSGYLTYMACNDGECLPPTDVEFEFVLD